MGGWKKDEIVRVTWMLNVEARGIPFSSCVLAQDEMPQKGRWTVSEQLCYWTQYFFSPSSDKGGADLTTFLHYSPSPPHPGALALVLLWSLCEDLCACRDFLTVLFPQNRRHGKLFKSCFLPGRNGLSSSSCHSSCFRGENPDAAGAMCPACNRNLVKYCAETGRLSKGNLCF